MSRTRTLLSLLILAGLLVGLVPGFLGAQELVPTATMPDDNLVVRLYYGTQDNLNAIAAEHDIWTVRSAAGYAVVLLTPPQYARLYAQGYRMETDYLLTFMVRHPDTIPGYPCYRTVEETHTAMQGLATAHPGLTELIDYGDSWDKLTPGGPAGYDLLTLRITNEAIGPLNQKPAFFLMAEIHAREYVTAEAAMRLAELILANYGTDPVTTFFVDYNIIYVVPMTNPDGRKFAEQGQSWRKNTNTNYCPGGSYGADLNRNHSFFWGCCGGSSGYSCDGTYRGPSPASEPEVYYLQNYVTSVLPDHNGPNGDNEYPPASPDDAMGVFITLHSYSELILWPWGHSYSQAPNAAGLQTFGRKMAYYNDYNPQQGINLYPTDGTTDDWSYGKLGVASYTYEMGTTFFQGCSSFESTIWPDNRDALLYAWTAAEAPYMLSYGPDALDAAVIPGLVSPGDLAELTATMNDTRRVTDGAQNITAAEYFVLPLHSAAPPGDPGTGTAMQPADGNWNSSIEDVVATVDTAGLTPGEYLIALRGQDANGDWGPFSAVFLHIVEPGVSPTIEGYVRDASNNVPLAVEATVTAGSFQTTSEAGTGYYSMTVISGTYEMSAVAAGYAISTVTGIEAHNYETVQQDFYLSPICEIFSDDVEGGNLGWTAEHNWAITTEAAHSPSHSWTDSPGSNYGNYWDYSLISPIWDLSDYTGIAIDFWHIYDLENGYDYGYLEVSTNGGSSWTGVASYNGEDHNTWEQAQVALSMLDGQANARIRFRIDTDSYVTADGWHIDDIMLTGGGPGCITPQAPVADFTSNSPVMLIEPMVFTNLTTGTVPMNYLWHFGDGDTSTEEHPTHLYDLAGIYTVTLDATNDWGTDSVSHPVEVLPVTCMPLTGIAVDGPTGGEPGVYTFTTAYEPANATLPIDYLWDNGDTMTYTVRNLDVGTHTLIVTATNCTDTVVVDDHTIVITPTPVCTEVTGVDLTLVTTGTIHPGDEVAFHADVAPDDAEKPYSYRVTVDGTAGPTLTTSLDPVVFTHTFDLTGTHWVEIAVWNCDMADAVTDAVSLAVHDPYLCVPLTGITIAGPTASAPGVYTFTTSYEPPDATSPVAYLWDNGDTTAFSTRNLDVGTHTLTVTATNCTNTVVLDDHVVVIELPVTYYFLYLPVVYK